MPFWILIAVLLTLAGGGFMVGRQKAEQLARAHGAAMHSRPGHHGMFVALWVAVPAFLLAVIGFVLVPIVAEALVILSMPDSMLNMDEGQFSLLLSRIATAAFGSASNVELTDEAMAMAHQLRANFMYGISGILVVCAVVVGVGYFYSFRKINVDFRARTSVETFIKGFLIFCSCMAIFTTVGIIASLVWESYRFFSMESFWNFVFGLHWSPQTAIRSDQVGASGSFGSIPLFTGTLLITFIAMCVAVPIGLLSAIYLSDYASDRVRGVVKPVLEILAGIPTVVYGFFAALTMAPVIREAGESLGMDVASESALAAGIVMGIMIIPFVSSLSDDVINSVPQSLREAAYGLGATKSECLKQVILPAALPGIFAAVLLAVSRAIGETMIVVMAAGMGANLTINPLDQVTTVTVQIVALLTGDQEFDSAKTLSAFALGLMLFFATLIMNIVALHVVRKYREKYD